MSRLWLGTLETRKHTSLSISPPLADSLARAALSQPARLVLRLASGRTFCLAPLPSVALNEV